MEYYREVGFSELTAVSQLVLLQNRGTAELKFSSLAATFSHHRKCREARFTGQNSLGTSTGAGCLFFATFRNSDLDLLTLSLLLYKLQFMDALDAKFTALADPTRRAILARLALGQATVSQLAAPFKMTQPAISQHLKVLEGAGLIVSRVEGTRRPRRLTNSGFTAMDEWLGTLRTAMEKNYDRLDKVLAASKKKGLLK